MTAPKLRALQQWLSVVVQHPLSADRAIGSAAARQHFAPAAARRGDVVTPSAAMSPTDRLQVYNGGYLSRLAECLATDYPVLQQLLGRDRFARLAAAYVQRHPSRHPNLNRFGKQLPAFLQRQRLPHRAFAVELARLELSISLSFDAPAFTAVTTAQLQALTPQQWSRARLSPNPSVHLLALRFPVDAYYRARKDDVDTAVPRPARSWLLVCRHDHRVWRLPLTQPAHALLTALAAGKPLGEALAVAGDGAPVGAWFQQWAAMSVFTAVRLRR